MDAVTYPHPDVAAELQAYFVAARVDIVADHAAAREARVLWTPTLVFWSRNRVLLREAVGFLPPELLLPQLRFVRGMDALRSGRYDDARALFDPLAEQTDARELAPEAFFWSGVALYLRDNDKETL